MVIKLLSLTVYSEIIVGAVAPSYLNLLSSTDGGASFELQKIAPSVIMGGTNLVWGGACRWECQIYRGVCRGVQGCAPLLALGNRGEGGGGGGK
jgi:hypothetical protein